VKVTNALVSVGLVAHELPSVGVTPPKVSVPAIATGFTSSVRLATGALTASDGLTK
jgi:hypothetical protein